MFDLASMTQEEIITAMRKSAAESNAAMHKKHEGRRGSWNARAGARSGPPRKATLDKYRACAELGLTVQQTAKRLSVSESTVSRVARFNKDINFKESSIRNGAPNKVQYDGTEYPSQAQFAKAMGMTRPICERALKAGAFRGKPVTVLGRSKRAAVLGRG